MIGARFLAHWIRFALLQSELSRCPRRRMGCVLVRPATNFPLVAAYNGPPRGPELLCGGDRCSRDELRVPSGQRTEIGCDHAEANAVGMCAEQGVSTSGAWAFVSGEPCLACAKLLLRAGIARVVAVRGGYAGENGVASLVAHGIPVDLVDGPADPRLLRPG